MANIDAGGLGVVELPELTVFAKAPGMLSSLGRVASKLFTGAASLAGNAGSVLGNIAPMAGELGTLTHVGIELEHALLTLGEVEGVRGVGEQAAHPQDWYVNKKTGKLKWLDGSGEHAGYTHLGGTDYIFSGPTLKELVVKASRSKLLGTKKYGLFNANKFDPSRTWKYNHNLFTSGGFKMDFYSTITEHGGTSPVELIINPLTDQEIGTNYYTRAGILNIGTDGSFSVGSPLSPFLSVGAAPGNLLTLDLSVPHPKGAYGTTIYYNPQQFIRMLNWLGEGLDKDIRFFHKYILPVPGSKGMPIPAIY